MGANHLSNEFETIRTRRRKNQEGTARRGKREGSYSPLETKRGRIIGGRKKGGVWKLGLRKLKPGRKERAQRVFEKKFGMMRSREMREGREA